jgi:hypothetical protein
MPARPVKRLKTAATFALRDLLPAPPPPLPDPPQYRPKEAGQILDESNVVCPVQQAEDSIVDTPAGAEDGSGITTIHIEAIEETAPKDFYSQYKLNVIERGTFLWRLYSPGSACILVAEEDSKVRWQQFSR